MLRLQVQNSDVARHSADQGMEGYAVRPLTVELFDNDPRHRLVLNGTILSVGFDSLTVAADTWIPSDVLAGTRLELHALFQHIALIVQRVDFGGKIVLAPARYTRKTAELFFALMIAGNASITFREARKALGFKPRLEPYIRFKRIDSADAYQAVLLVRGRTYHRVGKQRSPEPIEDPHDRGALVYAGYIGNRIVSSFRLRLLTPSDQFDHELHGADTIEPFPPREQCAEIGRLCVDPDVYGSDAAMSIFRYSVYTILLCERRFLVAVATGGPLQGYLKLGGIRSKIKFRYRIDAPEDHYAFWTDIHTNLSGGNIAPGPFAHVWRWTLAKLRARASQQQGIRASSAKTILIDFLGILWDAFEKVKYDVIPYRRPANSTRDLKGAENVTAQ
ncbi:MAG: hypothetical protein IT566_10835 [Rhodospirillaceae bacterium]|nr:hypothetical protein [Rhodospirillaceae bacterium]